MHVVTAPSAPWTLADGAMRIHQIPAATDNLVWIVECTVTGAAAVIDGPDAAGALAYCEAHGLTLSAVWNTHTHGDHVGINRDLQARGRLAGLEVVGPEARRRDVPGITRGVVDGDRVEIGALSAEVWLTEGHVDGHISFVFDGAVFCGDTLFAGGCGYLFDGPPATMFASLLRLAELPGDTLVCCAHEYTEDNLRFAWSVEPDNAALADRIQRVWGIRATGRCTVPSTIEEERATNPFLRPGSPTIQRSLGGAGGTDLVEVFAATRARKDSRGYRAAGDTGLPLSP